MGAWTTGHPRAELNLENTKNDGRLSEMGRSLHVCDVWARKSSSISSVVRTITKGRPFHRKGLIVPGGMSPTRMSMKVFGLSAAREGTAANLSMGPTHA